MPPEQALAITDSAFSAPPGPPTPTKVRVPSPDGPKEVRGKLKRALDLMVYGDEQGERYDFITASRKCQFTPHAMRKALERPHVQRYLREQKQVFRNGASAGNIHRALEIRDQDKNQTAAIQAIKYLDGLDDRQSADSAGKHVTPGVVVHIAVNASAPAAVDGTLIEINPAADTSASD